MIIFTSCFSCALCTDVRRIHPPRASTTCFPSSLQWHQQSVRINHRLNCLELKHTMSKLRAFMFSPSSLKRYSVARLICVSLRQTCTPPAWFRCSSRHQRSGNREVCFRSFALRLEWFQLLGQINDLGISNKERLKVRSEKIDPISHYSKSIVIILALLS